MSNRLRNEKSPYLLQHANNPVDWYAWGDAAFEKARAEDKPIFLSIGYSTCHWCHVMERESFENESVAALLNRWFVPIKVDREERPDVDRLYMTALQAMGLGGGWPLNAFLTPRLEAVLWRHLLPARIAWRTSRHDRRAAAGRPGVDRAARGARRHRRPRARGARIGRIAPGVRAVSASGCSSRRTLRSSAARTRRTADSGPRQSSRRRPT